MATRDVSVTSTLVQRMQRFIAGVQCSHKMRYYYSSRCELLTSTQSAVCPGHRHSQPESVVAMKSLRPQTRFDQNVTIGATTYMPIK